MRHVSSQPQSPKRIPLTEPVLLILISLAGQPRHGYALIKDIESLTDGRIRLSTGTLFGALRRLLASGWIARSRQADTSRYKQTYKLTALGRKNLEIDLARIKEVTRLATARLKAREA